MSLITHQLGIRCENKFTEVKTNTSDGFYTIKLTQATYGEILAYHLSLFPVDIDQLPLYGHAPFKDCCLETTILKCLVGSSLNQPVISVILLFWHVSIILGSNFGRCVESTIKVLEIR